MDHEVQLSQNGPDGVNVANGKVFGATANVGVCAPGVDGQADLDQEADPQCNEGIDMAPGYHDGTVYVSTVPGNAKRLLRG